MEPRGDRLRLYGEPSDVSTLEWSWVATQLADAGTYWITAGAVRPHARPLWGVWNECQLHLSIGSPTIRKAIAEQPLVSVHLESATDVVLAEGAVVGTTDDPAIVSRYERKYDWTYDVDAYGPLTTVVVDAVMAWRSAGWAGRDGFVATGRWRLPPPAATSISS